ncbi:hypothetical protein HYDPIDRAFT_44746 [Hydnomerulius pinastri MD-312]|uniref:Uncharacterized protein n=1 Tax=Hydnomerulius pinastri MD-312 TaxID=994086 RepID=A0A0C9VX29_9AGAM|nr:hypothetical protein HYDPIDRAFT_44746 [Hydnomerulius pinastri MD-312]
MPVAREEATSISVTLLSPRLTLMQHDLNPGVSMQKVLKEGHDNLFKDSLYVHRSFHQVLRAIEKNNRNAVLYPDIAEKRFDARFVPLTELTVLDRGEALFCMHHGPLRLKTKARDTPEDVHEAVEVIVQLPTLVPDGDIKYASNSTSHFCMQNQAQVKAQTP